MTVERETAGFALPFAAGVTAAAYAGNILYTRAFNIAAISSAVIYAILIFSLTGAGNTLLHKKGLPCIILLAFITGISCGFSDILLSASGMKGRLAIAAAGFGEKLGAVTDGLPFTSSATNAVMKAFITGDQTDMPESLKVTFRASGASHLLALSGFHLGIIYAIVKYSLSLAGNRRTALIVRSIVTVLICTSYTLATGASPSTVRALIFIALRETATITHRCSSLALLTLVSVVIQLAASPSSARSISFQLSYAAMAGIAFIYPWLKSAWPEEAGHGRISWKFLRRIWNSAALSISCQITTGPLAWIYFHTFPRHFLLTNLIALPLAGAVIPGGILVIILNHAGICPEFMLKAVEFLVNILIRSLEIIATM